MPDPLVPADPGLLASILDTASLGGSAIRNILRGTPGGAARNMADILGRTTDALIPGDWISDLSGPEDRPEFRDVIDLGGDNAITDVLNFAGDMGTDPLTYVPGAAFAKAGSLAKQGISKGVAALPKAISEPLVKGAAKLGEKTRATFGAQRVSEGTAQALRAKQAASDLVGRAGSEGTVDALSGLSERELNALGEVGHNMRLDPATGKPVALLDPSETMNFDQRLAKLVAEDPSLSAEKLLAAAPKLRDTLKAQWEAGQQSAASPGGGVFFNKPSAGTPDVVMGGMASAPSQGVREYFPRQFSGMKADGLDEITGLPKPIAERADWRDADVLDFLAKNPDVGLEFNAAKALAQRMGTQGELAGRAQIGQSLFDMAKAGQVNLPDELLEKFASKAGGANGVQDMLGATGPGALGRGAEKMSAQADMGAMLGGKPRPVEAGPAPKLTDYDRKQAKDWLLSQDFKLADPELRGAAQAIAKQFPAEEATVLLNALNGMAPPGAMVGALNKLSTFFKPYAVYGAFIPKLGSITRNLSGGLLQQFANAEARGDVPRAAARLIPNWLHAVDDGVEKLTGARIGRNEFAQVDEAFKKSGGDPRKVLGHITDPTMQEAVAKGVLGNTFVNTEQLISTAAKGGWKAFAKNAQDYPGAIFRGAEMRMRYGLFKAMRAKGKSADEAAKIVEDSFYNYAISSTENRTARSIIPFFQFMGKAIPQQSKLLAEKPYIASALANLQGGGGHPVYPGMMGRANIPLGQDEEGNQQYLTSLGLPVEALNAIPNPSANLLDFGRQVEQNVVGSIQPLLKTAYSVTSGREPFFGSQYGAYGKLPFIGEAGATGRAINQLIGTGLPGVTQGASILQTLGKGADERTSLGEKALNLFTGAKIQSVDESRALQQLLENTLKRDPSISQFTTLYSRSDDADSQALLDSLKQAKAEIKAKKKALVPAN